MKTIEQKTDDKTRARDITPTKTPRQKREWLKPEIEEVSEQVMAQPYIRFT